MNRSTGKAPVPAVATPDRARKIHMFWQSVQRCQEAFEMRIVADGIEIHDDLVPGTYPAIITESGELELITERTLAAADDDGSLAQGGRLPGAAGEKP